jgi:hypothetical protein
MTSEERLAAHDEAMADFMERANEAGLDAERIYVWLADEAPEELAIEYVRGLLKLLTMQEQSIQRHRQLIEILKAQNAQPPSPEEVAPSWMTD